MLRYPVPPHAAAPGPAASRCRAQLTDEGVLRYGFHGLFYEYIASVLPEHAGPRADGRVIVAHLGNGASMCAMRNRRSVASTMGFTALDGLMMGTRSGALDPGVVLHLLQQKGMTPNEVANLLYKQVGPARRVRHLARRA